MFRALLPKIRLVSQRFPSAARQLSFEPAYLARLALPRTGLFRSVSTQAAIDPEFIKTQQVLLNRLSGLSSKLNISAHKDLQKILADELDHANLHKELVSPILEKEKAFANSWRQKRGYEIASELRRNLGLTDLVYKIIEAKDRDSMMKAIKSKPEYLALLIDQLGLDLSRNPNEIGFVSLQRTLGTIQNVIRNCEHVIEIPNRPKR